MIAIDTCLEYVCPECGEVLENPYCYVNSQGIIVVSLWCGHLNRKNHNKWYYTVNLLTGDIL